ncbi:hypothetical protein [Streptomyces uncialis]|nr:hypothetical protein [Streptomyces uncialis]MCX4657682.1 hypothetical protein [Streptomyces uncialis]
MSERNLCPSFVSTRPEDLQRFREMPMGTNEVPAVMGCEYEPGHSGTHIYGVQEEMSASTDQEGELVAVYWWAGWGDGSATPYTISVMDPCPESYGYVPALGEEGMCCLPLDHPGPHSPGGAASE